ncbi:phosphoribosylglycinamide formyltransferase [Sphingosinicella rhizophila]|uniref:Phosphoribosylglycinamide formyltransferase n=1 Tax=Sphingosinicella rhizophila TaxID=3050082 RepID=A0ABU3Q2S8_9SPHN|nr:phosphoribosylglycinamide formyltransferase [Sphingosinicella sp. GR2756]MDT9597721.1 phosphoribosylglycinamide formyltransferase [Sphingosinicella sp. GR2756]
MAERIKVGVLLSGRGTNMIALSEYKRREERNYDIVFVGSNVPEARGLVVARRLGIPNWAQSHRGMERAAFDRLVDAELRRHQVELIALAGYMRLLSAEFIRSWADRILNIHPSLLPLYKGLDTHKRALASGDLYAGCSVHLVTEELDAGPVLAQTKIRIRPRDDAETLAERVLEEEHKLYPAALDEFAGKLLDKRQAGDRNREGGQA